MSEILVEVRSFQSRDLSCRSTSFNPQFDNHCIFVDTTPIGHVWRDHPKLPWNYLATGMFSEGRTSYPDWTIGRCCYEVWKWRCKGWADDIEWRSAYGLPPNPAIDRLIHYPVSFYELTGESSQQVLMIA
jgi:hypothetical protein